MSLIKWRARYAGGAWIETAGGNDCGLIAGTTPGSEAVHFYVDGESLLEGDASISLDQAEEFAMALLELVTRAREDVAK